MSAQGQRWSLSCILTCSVFAGEGFGSSDFRIRRVAYHSSQDSLEALKYKGPKFMSLDPNLQGALKEYLIARGVGAELTDFLLKCLHSKDQNQYVTWLRTMESLLANQHESCILYIFIRITNTSQTTYFVSKNL
ncbi:Mitochondrial glycoprotein [Dioscorea alata]|uniref:Mitochondrial glycoprotein n=1 Tax=Dioscorea alata TaxID=55571 RepID=A0ACB7VX02_DIOAL|nr:Mitochondrial glycoprotein [Dioscorea alata]